ncbi:hypothetical protein BDB00DRAFT_807993 [Zychaea mexicana]|uniref:uncharacterized protein n=1 Tax=Zychaea mexicana TaxID=64656 RepID=UPI0022FEF43E|nr:uncharacterized protein BDB00DRAFT_807993 [Zychaea mexicana]KAI9496604.1 hypothetical protein BDB00DRAFT_807993 [Zychaea mexicana]
MDTKTITNIMLFSRSLDEEIEFETYGSNDISPQIGVAGSILIILGLYLMTLGVRALRPTLGIVGFLTFGTLTWVGLANSRPSGGYSNDPITMITVPAGLGILGAVVYTILERITVYLISALGGLALALYICSWQEDNVITQQVARACFLAVLPIFMAAISFMAQHYLLLFSTAFAGSYAFIVGIDFLAHTGYLSGIKRMLDQTHDAPYYLSTHVYVLLVMTGVICLISFGWQYFYNKPSGSGGGGGADKGGADEEEAPAVTTAATVGGFSSHSSYAGGNGNGNGHSGSGHGSGNGNGNGRHDEGNGGGNQYHSYPPSRSL